MKTSPFKYQFAVIAIQDSSTYFYINNHTQGEQMNINGYDLAYIFNSKEQAANKIERMKLKYRGLNEFKIEYRKLDLHKFGQERAMQSFYWKDTAEKDISTLKTEAQIRAFISGYYDALAVKSGMIKLSNNSISTKELVNGFLYSF
jgi:hypothetical protein